MKKILILLSLLAAVAAALLLSWSSTDTIAPAPVVATAKTPAAFASLPVDIERTVDVDFDDETYEMRTTREQRDQVLDWLLLAVLSDAGMNAEPASTRLRVRHPRKQASEVLKSVAKPRNAEA